MPPVGGVGALGVVGLRRAGVGLGGLRQRRQAAAEAPGGREQGRGVGAGSLGLQRRAFRLPAVRAVPGASVRIALRVGWRVAVGRGGAPSAPTDAGGRGRLGPAAWSRRSSATLAAARPPGLRCRTRRGDGTQLGRGPGRGGAGELGRGRGRRSRRSGPRRVARRRLGADPGIGEKTVASGLMARGLGVRPTAGLRQAGRAGRRLRRNWRFARRFPTPRRSPTPLSQPIQAAFEGPCGSHFCGFFHRFRPESESCPIK